MGTLLLVGHTVQRRGAGGYASLLFASPKGFAQTKRRLRRHGMGCAADSVATSMYRAYPAPGRWRAVPLGCVGRGVVTSRAQLQNHGIVISLLSWLDSREVRTSYYV